MAYYTKVKKDFSFRAIRFKNIECYEGDGSVINVTVTGTAQMIRQILKAMWYKVDAEGTWVKTRKFAGGNSIDVYLNRVPDNIYKAIKADIEVFDEYPVNHNNAKRIVIKTDDGKIIDAGTKYLHVYNEPPYGSKESELPAPDWDKILNSEPDKAPKADNSGGKTPTQKWDRGTMLRSCGGWKVYKKTLPDGRVVYNAVKDKETQPNKGDWATIKSEIYVATGFKWGRAYAFEKWGDMTPNDENLILEPLCEILTKYYVSTQTTTEPQAPTSNDFVYGANFGVPTEYGEMIIDYLKGFGFEVFKPSDNKGIFIISTPYRNAVMTIVDNGGEFNLEINDNVVAAVYYIVNDKPQGAYALAKRIEDEFIQNSTIISQRADINDSYKSLPANPKLEYCKITSSEVFGDDELPATFQSFTALTKFIADNSEIPSDGTYDKHRVEWKWKFEDKVRSDRWDVSTREADPNKYPNLYASEKLLSLCYQAWAKNGAATVKLAVDDDYFANEIGKDGFELTNDQFNTILTGYLTYYPVDTRGFSYNTPEDRLLRFKNAYPKLINTFTQPEQDDKEEIREAIIALTYLADAGDEEAKEAIIALNYLI